MKRVTFIIFVTALCIFSPVAQAHVFVTDETESQGAIVHITPDDDPVAGEEAILYFDTQNNSLNDEKAKVTLTIENEAGEKIDAPTTRDGTLVMARYTFPVQGVYELKFIVGEHTFAWQQRVSRGVVSSPLDRPSYVWAEALIVGSCVGLVALLTVAYSRRRAIAGQSVFN